MKTETFMEIFNDIDGEFIEKAHASREKGKILSPKKWFALIAAILLFGATATVVIAAVRSVEYKGTGRWILYNGSEKYGYEMTITVENVPENSFGENIDSVRKVLVEKAEDHSDCLVSENGTEVHSCGYVSKEFLVRNEAAEWLDYDGVKIIDFREAGHIKTFVTVHGDYGEPGSGKIAAVTINSQWKKSGISFGTQAEINTDISGKTTYSYHMEIPEGSGVENSYKKSKNGTEYIVLRIYPKYGNGGFTEIQSMLVKDGILYSFNADFKEEKLEECYKILEEWADNF